MPIRVEENTTVTRRSLNVGAGFGLGIAEHPFVYTSLGEAPRTRATVDDVRLALLATRRQT